ncbi:hypothetical protein ABVK25_011612 [Lepraria finkii]|uniref:MARVEL domain-containing protein n=1 Tax=Lepraria finkii TaxID=1340010 RepID=A0ABR4ANM8_9LECA
MQIVQLGLRGLQFLWTLLILALVGNMIAEAVGGNPSIVNYVMFVAVFGMLSLFYLIAATIVEAFAISAWFVVAADALNTLFFLIGGIVLAADLGVHSCGNKGYIATNGTINGSTNQSKRCHEAQAVTAFLWFGFATFLASLAFSALAAKSGGGLSRGGVRRGGPAMSQV